jgi:nucleotide-binding universal stress UspA family protein
MESSTARVTVPIGPQRILVGFDGSDPSQRAARLALAWGRAAGASLWIVHASETPRAVAEPRTEEEQGMATVAITGALTDLTRYAEVLAVPTTVWMREGSPARVLLDSAAEMRADLIIVGTRGLRGPARVLLGSVSSAVLSQAGRPVLVVP